MTDDTAMTDANGAAPAAAATKGSDAPEAAREAKVYQPPGCVADGSLISSMAQYRKLHSDSLNPEFWARLAKEELKWFVPFDATLFGGFDQGNVAWFVNGKLNACTNCVDRHVKNRGDKVAIIWEADEPGQSKKITYRELLANVCRVANALKSQGVRKGDPVTIYMPMVPELAYTMLACARIGAPHSIVFAGFSASALQSRIENCRTRFVVTVDEGKRGGRTLRLKDIVDKAVKAVRPASLVQKVFVFRRTGGEVRFDRTRDVWMDGEGGLLEKQRPFCPAESMDAEDTLFLLYTSGSTGAPKGVAHTTAGYLLWTATTHKYVFDLREDDVFACVADCGWITGHSYIVYGPLCNGATTLMFESTPLYPDAGRYWDMVATHKVTQFYTAPTAIRALIGRGNEWPAKYDLSSLRVLGTVGEPINPEAWIWYHEKIGGGRCAIVDTYWQTETGGHIVTPLPGATPTKPGSACFPFLGIDLALLDAQTGAVVEGNDKSGVLAVRRPWPGMTRTVFGDHQRYLNVYLKPYPGYYFTGDGCHRDADGYYWITGRVDDVLNISGHRIGTAEIEAALLLHDSLSEAAVVGFPHDVKGQGMICYCVLKQGVQESPELLKALRMKVRAEIGPFATPDHCVIAPGLPKTRSGKTMRRILRKIVAQETEPRSKLGDISTLIDPTVVEKLIVRVNDVLARAKAACQKK
jgi:acetyl-CoA synthetase